jgi:Fic family protein
VSELSIQTLHALVLSNGRTKIKPSAYRQAQNVVKDGHSGAIVYMPPEAKDVSK